MEIKLERFNAFNLPRIAQLTQRSNQFNLMTRRYGEAACEAMMSDPFVAPLTVKLADKFGDYGLVQSSSSSMRERCRNRRISDELPGFAARRRKFHHEQHLFLCRAARRETGNGRYIPTKKNDMVRDFFQSFGFEKVADGEGGASQWALAVEAYQPREIFMTPVVNEL